MGQSIHDSSLCNRAKRCINNISDCSNSEHDRKRVRLSNENQGPPVYGSTGPTVASQTALEQAISDSRRAMITDQIDLADADKALVDEFATVLAIASQIALHQAAAIQRPVRFTVNQSMAPSPGILFLQMSTMRQARELMRRWEASDYAHIRINEISFTLGDDSDNQPIAANQTATPLTDLAAADQALVNQAITELAAIHPLTGVPNQVTASFFVMLYSRMFDEGGIWRDTVRRWIQSGNARLPVNIEVPRLAAASVENPNGAQIAVQPTLLFRATEAIENEFQRRILLERRSISLSQQEHGNDASLRHSQEPEAVEQLRDEDQDSDAATIFTDNPFLRGFTTEEIYAHIPTNRGSRRGMDGASSDEDEDRRMEMSNRGRRNAILFRSGALNPVSNATVTYSGPPDADDL